MNILPKYSEPMSKKDASDLVEGLKKSPVFNISLASKELFHSNFWAWLFETPRTNSVKAEEYIQVFFPSYFAAGGCVKVARERDNIDVKIVVETEEEINRYIIENKVKSIPSIDQLRTYTKKIEGGNLKRKKCINHYLLTSIIKPIFDLPDEWGSKTLGEIGGDLQAIATRENDDYRRMIIQDYGRSLVNLSQLMQFEDEGSELYNFHFSKGESEMNSYLSEIKELRIYDLYVKRKISQLAHKIQSDFHGTPDVYINVGFNNGKGTLNAYLLENIGAKTLRVGIQIEGNQYRYHIESEDLEGQLTEISSGRYPALVESCMNEGWFVAAPKEKWPKNSEAETSMRNTFCVYKPAFLYQYTNIRPSTTYDELSERIRLDIEKARSVVINLKSVC